MPMMMNLSEKIRPLDQEELDDWIAFRDGKSNETLSDIRDKEYSESLGGDVFKFLERDEVYQE